MAALLDVILPVFLVLGFGYLAAWRSWIGEGAVDAIMRFAQTFAVPMLLFAGIARIDLGATFNAPLMLSFYSGAFAGGFAAFAGARFVFRRALTDSIAIGFVGTFSNALLLGLSITERAYGAGALSWNYAIISIHAPLLYMIGIVVMEIARTRGQGLSPVGLVRQTSNAVFRNPLIIGIGAGWIVNISGVTLPVPVWDAVEMMMRAAIPTALFGLGGILYRYRPEGDMRVILWAVSASLLVHPVVTYLLGSLVFDLPVGALRSATVSAAMAPGVNVYIFANLYGVAKRVAASAVLIGTALSIFTTWCWLLVLP